jgi:hypothetical protein
MNPEKLTAPTPPPIAPHVPEPVGLDIHDPLKWQMKVRLHLESLSVSEAEKWMSELRLITTMAGRVVRDEIYRRVTTRCIICERPFKEGRPAGDGGYVDADREYIKIYICDQSEYSDMLKYIAKKEHEIAAAEERAEKAAQQAAKDARSKSLRA